MSHRLTTLTLACLIVAAPLFPFTAAQAQTVEPLEITLREGGKDSAPIVAKNGDAVVTPTQKAFDPPGIVDYDLENKVFKPLKAGRTVAKLKFGEGENATALPDIKINVLPKIESYKVSYAGTNFTDAETIRIGQGVTWKDVATSATDAKGETFKVKATVTAGTDNIELSGDSPYTLKAKGKGKAEITLKADDNDPGKKFKVDILPPIAKSSLKVDDVSLAERSTKNYAPDIRTTAGEPVRIGEKEYGVKIFLNQNDYVKLKEPTTLEAQTIDSGDRRVIDARLQLPLVDDGAGGMVEPADEDANFKVTVIATGAYMYFIPSTQPLLPGGSARIEAYFRDRNGAPIQSYLVEDWTVDSQYDKYVELAEEGNAVTVLRIDDLEEEKTADEKQREEAAEKKGGDTGASSGQTPAAAAALSRRRRRAKRPNVIPITAIARSTVNPAITITGKAFVQLREITKFQPLSVKLNVMDDTTAKDLYGGVAAREYYILMVRMFNDLRDDETKRYTGSSIIVYSGSVEVAVNLEKQYDKASKSAKANSKPSPSPSPGKESYVADGRWYEVDPEQDVQIPITDMQYTNKSPEGDDTQLPFGSDPVCNDTITYRPLMFEMVVNTVDRREGRSLRSRIFDGLELVGLGASFSSAIRFPRPGRDLPIVADRLGNLLVPGLEKFFPSLAEQHRQNIVSQVMKPLEEVPFGSDITRVLFIPKRALRGMIPNHKVRISQVCPYYFKIRVAVVDKSGQTTVEQGVQRQ
jgi:hypothetical protein